MIRRGMILFFLAAACSVSAGERAEPDPRPNILFALSDDWSWPHAGAYGDPVVRTPVFDRLAAEGALFSNAYCVSPSCSPSRCSILAGQAIHRLEEGGNLWSTLPAKFAVYPELLEKAGYVVGRAGKSWGPGNLAAGGRTRNPCGEGFKNLGKFLQTVPEDKPFCFWFGGVWYSAFDPHRPYDKGSGKRAGMNPDDVVVPPYLPDTPEVRSDMLDYYFEVQRFDRDFGRILKQLEASGRVKNTIVVYTSDNGWPFPRAKGNLYDGGTRMPMAVRWPAGLRAGTRIDSFVSFADLAPTFLEAGGVEVPAEMSGRSFLDLMKGGEQEGRDKVFVERERHTNSRKGGLSYPMRAVRTKDYLYIRNLRPDRWPAGDPEGYEIPDNPHGGTEVGKFADVDQGPTKFLMLDNREKEGMRGFFRLAFGKRPAEELYDLKNDPGQIRNVADLTEYGDVKRRLRGELDKWMVGTKDPRAFADDDRWDRYPYIGHRSKIRKK